MFRADNTDSENDVINTFLMLLLLTLKKFSSLTQLTYICSKLTIETPEQCVKYVQIVDFVLIAHFEQVNAGWKFGFFTCNFEHEFAC